MSETVKEVQVAKVCSIAEPTITHLLEEAAPSHEPASTCNFGQEQRKDMDVKHLVDFVEQGELRADTKLARKAVALGSLCTMEQGILYYVDPKHRDRKRAVVPVHLREQIMRENHSGLMAGHFSGNRLYSVLLRHWWWEGMYSDTREHCKSCAQCAIVTGTVVVVGKLKPPLHPIRVQRAFQIVGVDVMHLPVTESGNKHVLVFQDFLTKWPMIYPIPNQQTVHIVRLFAEQVVPMFGVPVV